MIYMIYRAVDWGFEKAHPDSLIRSPALTSDQLEVN